MLRTTKHWKFSSMYKFKKEDIVASRIISRNMVNIMWTCTYHIFANSFLPWIISPLNSFRNNYSTHEVKNRHNAEIIWKFPHFPLSTKNSFLEIRYLLSFSQVSWNINEMNIPHSIEPHRSRSHSFQISNVHSVVINMGLFLVSKI